MLAIVLLLSNLSIVEDNSKTGEEASKVTPDETFQYCKQLMQVHDRCLCLTPTTLLSSTALDDAGSQVDGALLEEALTVRTSGGGAMGTFTKPLTVKQAMAARDALCMLIYHLAFKWCVAMLNEKLYVAGKDVFASVRILDVFGFENFKRNGLPQVSPTSHRHEAHSFVKLTACATVVPPVVHQPRQRVDPAPLRRPHL